MAAPPSPFPLPLRRLEFERFPGAPRYLARRQCARRRLEELVAAGVSSINALAAARGGGPLRPEVPRRIREGEVLSPCQSCMLDNVGRAARLFVPVVKEDMDFPDGALAEVLATKNLYDLDDVSTVARYDPSKLKVLKGNTRPKDARLLVGPEARRFLDHADELIVRPQRELLSLGAPTRPHWDPALAGPAARKEFVDLLRGVGLVTFRRRARCHVGAFFVRKKGDQIRLVVDCRPANELHRPPPKSFLSTPGALAGLICSDEWAHLSERLFEEAGGAASVGGVGGRFDLHGASIDLQDGFYQFAVPGLASWFCLGVTYTAAEAGVRSVWCDEEGKDVEVAPSTVLWACFGALPMGWSWALFFCHATLQECGERALRRLGLPAVTLADGAPAPLLSSALGFVAPYVDNGNVIAGSPAACARILEALKSELLALELGTHEEVAATQDFVLLGKTLDGRRRALLPRRRRMWRLWFALEELERRRQLAPKQMRRVVGHLVDHLSVRRETLCALQEVYRFIGKGEAEVRPLGPALLAELRVVRGLLPLCVQSLDRPASTRVFCSDASDLGYAVHCTEARVEDVLAAARFRERWRFREVLPRTGLDRSVELAGMLASYAADPGYDREFSEWAEARMAAEEVAEPARPPLADGGPARPAPRYEEDAAGVPPLPSHWAEPSRWRRVLAGAWKSAGTIHCKEARAALVALRREGSDAARHRRVLLSLGDNMAEVLAFDRGRARDFELQSLVRRGCAWQVAADIKWVRRYIETGRNPSDADSRLANRGVLTAGQVFVGPGPLLRRTPLSAAVPRSWCPSPSSSGSSSASDDASHEVGFVAPVVGRVSGGRRRDRETVAPGDAVRPPGGDLVARRRRRCRHPAFLEVFGGGMELTRRVADAGLRVALPLDVVAWKGLDLLDRRVENELSSWISSGSVWAVHFAPPCGQWSVAAGPRRSHPDLRLAWATVRLLRRCRGAGVRVSVENPVSSGLWRWQPLARELRRTGCADDLLDMCAYGLPWKKPTRWSHNLGATVSVAARCPGHAQHVRLQGVVAMPDGSRRWRTQFGAQYPPELARRWAVGLRGVAPPRALRRGGEPRLHDRWQRRLEAAVGLAAGRRLGLGADAVVDPLPWRNAVAQWGGLDLDIERRLASPAQGRRGAASPARAAAAAAPSGPRRVSPENRGHRDDPRSVSGRPCRGDISQSRAHAEERRGVG